MEAMRLFECGSLLRNALDVINITSEENFIGEYYLVNIKHVKRKGETEKYIFLKDVITNNKIGGLPTLDEAIRIDMFKFFNTQLTNALNRQLISTFAEIKIVNGKPKEGIVTIDNYTEDLPALVNLATKKHGLEQALRNIEMVESLDGLENIEEELNYVCETDEKVLPLIFVNKVKATVVEKVNIPKNSIFEKGMPMLVKDLDKIFPGSKLSPLTIEGETVVITDSGIMLLNRNYNENISIRKASFDEFYSYGVYSYKRLY